MNRYTIFILGVWSLLYVSYSRSETLQGEAPTEAAVAGDHVGHSNIDDSEALSNATGDEVLYGSIIPGVHVKMSEIRVDGVSHMVPVWDFGRGLTNDERAVIDRRAELENENN